MASQSESQFMTVRETAKILDVHENTIRNWVKAGVIRSARVPGSTHLRFERSEVARLQRERGRATSQVGPALRSDGPELVGATELARWAERSDSKGAFPDLMRRLLAATPGITDIEIRAYEGVAAPGWDGSAQSTGSALLPGGRLRFEFGTDRDPKHKAESDYGKRESDASVVYVQVTPRNWAGASGWADEKTAEGRFARVKALDAHSLELWLIQAPSVHHWISERLGFNPRGAQTIERWMANFLARTDPKLPPALFLAGRQTQADQLRDRLTAATTSSPVTIQSAWRDEVVAFVFAALESDADLLDQTLVVDDPATWDRLIDSRIPLVLIPAFDASAEISRALDRGHRVVVVAGADELVRDPQSLLLPKVDRRLADEALKAAVEDGSRRGSLTALARRSMPALFRSLDRNPSQRFPDWLRDPDKAGIVIPLVLAERWADWEGDLLAIEELTDRSRDKIETVLGALSTNPDAPFVRSAGGWRLAWPIEAALLALPRLTSAQRQRWIDVATRVLLDPDPYDGMTPGEQFLADRSGTRPRYSEPFRKAVSKGLALAGAVSENIANGLEVKYSVDAAVSRLLSEAGKDVTGATWRRLAPSLPDLAEASPALLLRAVEEDLDRAHPLVANLFSDTEQGIFGPSSPHPNLLWALESLCWAPDYFFDAATLLARLAQIDPGGRLSNRPSESLQSVTQGWIRNSGAHSTTKLAMIGHVVRRYPAIGWRLILGVWPNAHMVSSPPRAPDYRDWTPMNRGVSYAEWGDFVKGLTELAIQAAAADATRWKELIPGVDNLPPTERIGVLLELDATVRAATWSSEERYEVWSALRAETDHHDQFPDADWSLPRTDLDQYREIANRLEPTDDARLFAGLFDWRSHRAGIAIGDPDYEAELQSQQRKAIETTLAFGPDALTSLAREAKMSNRLAQLLAETASPPEDTILGWLNEEGVTDEERNLRQVALIWADIQMARDGLSWLTTLQSKNDYLTPRAYALLTAAAPFTPETWEKIDELGSDLAEEYWARVQPLRAPTAVWQSAVEALVVHGQAWKALELLSYFSHQNLRPEVDQVKRVFRAILTSGVGPSDTTMNSYYVEQMLGFLEETAPEDPELPQFEFVLFPMLHDNQPSSALYRTLRSDPDEFVHLIERLYRAENEPKQSMSAQDEAFAHIAWSVLREWHGLPGQRDDGTVDGDALMGWVRSARLALSDSGRGSVGDEQIGEVLACSPMGADGIWPAEEVRDVIENVGNARIDTGVQIGRHNRRGITSRDPFDGGAQERSLEARYRADAATIAARWPRTARVLRAIADSFRGESLRHDLDAEQWGDQG